MNDEQNINKIKNEDFLEDHIICNVCGGYGYTIEIEAQCCGNEESVCCGIPTPVQVQVECRCDKGYIKNIIK